MNDDKKILELIYKELMVLRQEIAYIKGRQDGMEDRICKKLDSMPNVKHHMTLPTFDHRVSKIDFSTVVCKK